MDCNKQDPKGNQATAKQRQDKVMVDWFLFLQSIG